MNTASKRAQKVGNDALAQAAQSGVARAIAARQAAGVELSAADVAQVSGGALVVPGIRAGGIPPLALLAATNPTTSPTLPGGAGFGMQGMGMVA